MSQRTSARTATATSIGIVAVAATAITSKDANLTGLVGAFVTSLLGILTNRHTAADIAGARPRALEPAPPSTETK